MSAQEAFAPPTRQHSSSIPTTSPVGGEQLTQAAVRVLTTPNAADKASLTHQTARMWRDGRLQCNMTTDNTPAVPARPARDDSVSVTAIPSLQPDLSLWLRPDKHHICSQYQLSTGAIGGAKEDEKPWQGHHLAKQAAPGAQPCPYRIMGCGFVLVRASRLQCAAKFHPRRPGRPWSHARFHDSDQTHCTWHMKTARRMVGAGQSVALHAGTSLHALGTTPHTSCPESSLMILSG